MSKHAMGARAPDGQVSAKKPDYERWGSLLNLYLLAEHTRDRADDDERRIVRVMVDKSSIIPSDVIDMEISTGGQVICVGRSYEHPDEALRLCAMSALEYMRRRAAAGYTTRDRVAELEAFIGRELQ